MSDTQELIGRVFDSRYQITELIGRGGMGVVYKAIHIAMNQVVALKVLGKGMSNDDRNVQRFYQEARASSRLKHPNTIKVFDFGRSEEGHLYLAMEFLDGQTLTQLLRQEKVLPVRRAITIARQVAKSLGEAHMNGLVHRDLKPDNVFITRIYGEEDFAKVLDFGIAKFLEGSPDHENLTQAGLVCGTPLYISPEQALGRSLDGRSDLYSLGVILYEMVSGRPPFRAETPIALVMRHIHDQPPPMTEHNPGLVIPESLRSLIFKLLDKDREKRPATAEDVLKELDAILAAGDFPEVPSKDLIELDSVGKPLGKTRVEALPDVEGEVDHEEATQFLNKGEAHAVDAEAPTSFLAPNAAIPREVNTPAPLAAAGSEETTIMPAPDELPTRVGDVPTVTRAQVRQLEQRSSLLWLWVLLAVLGVGALGVAGGFVLGWFDHTSGVEAAPPLASVQQPAPPPPGPAPQRSVTVRLETVPEGASVHIAGRAGGKSPYMLDLKEGDQPVEVRFEAPNYKELKVTLNPKDVLAGGITSFRYELEAAPKVTKQRAAPPLPVSKPPQVAKPVVSKPASGPRPKKPKPTLKGWDEE